VTTKPLLYLLLIGAAYAQPFSSGSTGADGALTLTTPGTVTFDPRTFNPPLNPSGNNIYQFTAIYIASGVTVKLSSQILTGPMFWLSQGPVQIDGMIDLDGSDGVSSPSLAGAGGYPGGAPKHPGYRPEGFTGNAFLVPLVGGSGGDGGETQGGGAGGGALLIASSASITVNGGITANGGVSSDGAGGSGGSIRLAAPIIDGSGSLSAKGGERGGADGRIRFEAFNNHFTGNFNETPLAQGKPFGLFLPPDPAPSVRVVSIDGVAPKNSEFSVNRASAVTVVVEARHVPPGTVVELQFVSENNAAQTVSTTPLVGTLDLSRAIARVTFARGPSHGLVKAVWK
jgi:hypothetical protein